MQKFIDKFGIFLSSACAIHCALAPLLIIIAPMFGLGFLFDESFENILLLIILGLAFLSLSWGFYKKHRKFLPLALLVLGSFVLFFVRSHGSAGHHHHPNDFVEPLFMTLAGIIIASAHFVNLRLCTDCNSCESKKS